MVIDKELKRNNGDNVWGRQWSSRPRCDGFCFVVFLFVATSVCRNASNKKTKKESTDAELVIGSFSCASVDGGQSLCIEAKLLLHISYHVERPGQSIPRKSVEDKETSASKQVGDPSAKLRQENTAFFLEEADGKG